MAKESVNDSFMSPNNSYPGHDAGTDAPARMDGVPFLSPATYVAEVKDSDAKSINVQRPEGVKGK